MEYPAVILRRVLIALALCIAALVAVLWLGSGLLGPLLLGRYGQLPNGSITAGGFSGPLWSPTAHDLSVQINGVQVSAKAAHIYLTQVNPFAKSARVNVALSDGSVDVHFKQLFAGLKGNKKNTATQAAAFKLLPGLVDIHNMRLNLDGQGANIPDARLKVSSQEAGRINLSGVSDYGPLSGDVHYGEVGGKTHVTINARSDARIINEYWHVRQQGQMQGGILGGELAAQYRIGNGPLEGDLKVMNATVAVPQAKFVRIERIFGAGQHRGNLITGQLRGFGLGGPVVADVQVDTKAKNWDVQAHATPTFAALGKVLGVPGSGEASLKVHAGGWTTVNVAAQLASAQGQFVNIPYTKLGATYGWQSSSQNRHTTITRNVLSVQAGTHLLGEQQRLWGDWHFNKAGKLRWVGKLAHKPLNVLDSIDRQNQMSLRGEGLGGPLQATFNPKRKRLSAQLSPQVYGLTGRLSASGPVSDLSLGVASLRGAGVQLSGAGRLNKAGLSLDLLGQSGGRVAVHTDRHWRGKWAVNDLKVPASGSVQAALTGQGALDLTRRLSGQLSASVRLPAGISARVPEQQASDPLVHSGPLLLSGPLSLDWKSRLGQWQAGEQRLSWQGQKLSVALRGLKLSGLPLGPLSQQTLNVGGLATYRLDTRAVGGRLSATAPGTKLIFAGLGSRVQATGTVRGLDGQDLSLRAQSGLLAPFDTTFSVAKGAQGAQGTPSTQAAQSAIQLLSGSARVGAGGVLSLEATTYGAGGPKHAHARIAPKQLTATGAVNLSALYPLLPASTQKTLAGLGGVALLNLRGQGGTVQVQAQASRGAVQGTLTRNATGGERWGADMQATAPLKVGAATQQVQAHLRGMVYPQLDLSGPVQAAAQTSTGVLALGTQRLQARIYGPYRALRVQAGGQTAPLTLGGVQFPAQALSVLGSLTPALALSGRWGQLGVQYQAQGNQVRVSGPQDLTVAGRPAQVTVAATWQPGFIGNLTAVGKSGEYQVRASGPWQKLSVALEGAGLRVLGTVNAQRQSYAATIAGQVSGLNVSGALSGVGARPHGQVTLRDAQGGQLQAQVASLSQFRVGTQGLRVAGQTLRGNLRAAGGLVSGNAQLGPLNVQARQGNFRAQGVYQRHQIVATGFWTLPQDFRRLNVTVNGPYIRAQAAGSGQQLRGTVTLLPQRYQRGAASVSLPAQTLPLSASVARRTVTVGGLNYGLAGWNGNLPLSYQVQAGSSVQAGRVTLGGKAQRLSAQLSGVLAGQVQVLPHLHGAVSAPLKPLTPLLPASMPSELALSAGRVDVRFDARGAAFTTQKLSWGSAAIGVSGQANWPTQTQPLRLSALLAQGHTRLPVQLRGRALRVSGGRIDAQTLRPLLSAYPSLKLSGPLRGDLTLNAFSPDLSLKSATASLGVNLNAGTQNASGTLSLSAGQWTGNLGSTLGGAALSVRGALYPQANATVRYSQGADTALTATLHGDARHSGAQQYQALLSGRYQGRPVQGKATLSPTQVAAQLDMQGAALNMVAQPPTQGAPLSRWKLRGALSVPQTQPLLGRSGQLSAQFAGTVQDIRGQVAGAVVLTAKDGYTQFTLPLRYQAGALSVQQGSASVPLSGTRLSATHLSGALWPTLGVRAQVTAGTLLPGVYDLRAAGTVSRPVIDAAGVLSGDVRGFGLRGTKLQARLSGKDLRLSASGAALSGFVRGRTDQPGYIQRAELKLATTYRAADTALNIRGPLSWTASEGWGGLLNVAGPYQGKALTAQIRGHGDLALEASYDPLTSPATSNSAASAARLSAALPASILQRPGGRVQLHAWDVGALWQRPEQLQLTGTALLGGANWAAWQAGIQGQLQDSAGELSGPIAAHYNHSGEGEVQLSAQKLLLSASLKGGAAQLDLHSRGVEFARLIPTQWNISRLNVVGHLAAQGSLSSGVQQLEASSLYVSGQQQQLGDFHVGGAASYLAGQRAQASLDGALLGGTLNVSGSLPAGLEVRASHLDLGRLNRLQGAATSSLLDAQLRLQGDFQNPALSGTAQLTRPDSLTDLLAYGRVQDPHLHARTQLLGKASGTLYADLWNLDAARRTAQMHIYGSAQQAQNHLKVDMQGVWPKLAGAATAQVTGLSTPVQLQGQGNGQYAAQAGAGSQVAFSLTASEGLMPQLQGQGTLDIPALLGAKGEGNVRVSVSGPLTQPQVLGQGLLRGVSRSGLSLNDATVTLNAAPAHIAVQMQQGAQEVATFDGQRLKLSGLQLQGLGSDLNLSGEGGLGGSTGPHFTGQLSASGSLQGKVSLNYAPQQLSAVGQLSASGFKGALNLQGAASSGWNGRVNVTGGPVVGGIGPVLTQPLNLRVGGVWQRPWVRGSLGLLGSRGRVSANQAGLALTFMDGPRAQASGGLNLVRKAGVYTWSGKAHFERAQGQVDLSVQGEAAKPQVSLSAQRGEWYSRGQLGLTGANLDFGDGQQAGTLTWQRSAAGQLLDIRSPALNLARLNIAGVSGRVQPYAHLQGTGLNGAAALYMAQVKTGLNVPYLGFALAGSGKVNAQVSAQQWQLGADLKLDEGPLAFELRQDAPTVNSTAAGSSHPALTGALRANLQRAGGVLTADVKLGGRLLTGLVSARSLNVALAADKQATVNGTLNLQGQQFALSAKAASDMGSATLSGAGGIANAAPAARRLLGILPTPDGYQLQAQIAELDVAKLGKGMDMSGKVGAQLTLGEGGGTFAVRAPALKLGESTLNTRIDGTRSGSDWRLRGVLGDTTFFGAVTDGQLRARAELIALPLGSLVEAASGKRVGQASVTGIARVDAPISDPLAGSATVVAERVKVTAEQQTLLGKGSLHFSARELTDIQLNMSGAGTWDIHGHYTRRSVNLSADFNNTTFTPLLALIPALGEQATLQGSLNMKLGGVYGNPTASVLSESLTGSYAGSRFSVGTLQGGLDTAGNMQAAFQVDATGTVGGKGNVQVSGKVLSGKLAGGLVHYTGTLSASSLGEMGNADVRIEQSAASAATTSALASGSESAWIINATAQRGGTLHVIGQVAPTPELTLTARNYNLPIRAIYARESSINADLKAASDAGLVLVSGKVDINRMLLGRPDALTKTGNPLLDAAEPAKAASSYNSPLPEALTTFSQSAEATQKKVPPFLSRVVFQDIPVRAVNSLRVEESLAQAELSADLRLSGTGDNPLLSGEAHSMRGSLSLRDTTFTVQKANAVFDGASLYPTFTLTAVGDVMDGGTRLGVQLQADGSFVLQPQKGGRTLALNTALTCTTCTSTAYTQAELYSLLALGTKDVNNVLDSQNLTALGTSAASTALNVFVLGELQRNIAHALGVDVFRINSNIIDSEGNLDASFTVGTHLSKQFYVQYQVDLTGKGLFDATYTTDNGRFTFKASTAMTDFNLETIKPSFSVLYNLGTRHSLSLGVESGTSTKLSAGYVYRW